MPRDSELEDLHSTNIANCVYNSFLSYTAIMLRKCDEENVVFATLKALLLNLAVSDVGVGLFVQPFLHVTSDQADTREES